MDLTAMQILALLRSRHLTAEAYVQGLIERADTLQGLHHLISVDREGAISSARHFDRCRARGEALPALAGLPIVVKDNINTRNLPTTGGTAALRDLRPQANAPVLQRLVDAGAILLGKANLHELSFGVTTSNLTTFAGIARNPYDHGRITGGSSGGSAGAVAAGIAPVALGTDTGGSVRIPSALCGICGLRPSVGNGGADRRYEISGVLPISHTRDTVGPMGRYLADVALLDAVVAGYPTVRPMDLAGLRLGLPRALWEGVDADVLSVMESAIARMAQAGVVLVQVDVPGLIELNEKAAATIALHEAPGEISRYLQSTGAQGVSLRDIAAQVSSPDVREIMAAVLGGAAGPGYQDAIGVHRPRMQALYADCFQRNGLRALVFPTVATVAPHIDRVHGSSTLSINGGPPVDTFRALIRNTEPGSTAGLPGVTLPAGLTAQGLPVGLALDAPVGRDRELLGIGMSLERLLGRLPAPSL